MKFYIQKFQPAKYCNEYPIVSYTLIVRSQQTGELLVNVSLAANETKVVLDELEGSQKYSYSVIATNKIGVSNSGESLLSIAMRHNNIYKQLTFIFSFSNIGHTSRNGNHKAFHDRPTVPLHPWIRCVRLCDCTC